MWEHLCAILVVPLRAGGPSSKRQRHREFVYYYSSTPCIIGGHLQRITQLQTKPWQKTRRSTPPTSTESGHLFFYREIILSYIYIYISNAILVNTKKREAHVVVVVVVLSVVTCVVFWLLLLLLRLVFFLPSWSLSVFCFYSY